MGATVSPGGKRGVLIGGIAVMVAVVVAAVVVLLGGGSSGSAASAGDTTTPAGPSAPDPTSAARQYVQAFAAGDTDTAGSLTDDPSDSSTLLSNAWQTLRPVEIQATLGTVGPVTGNTAPAAYTMTWVLSGGHNWSYNGTFGGRRHTAGSWATAVTSPSSSSSRAPTTRSRP